MADIINVKEVSPESGATRAKKRKNTTKACEWCRKRRVKCNGQTPTCACCSSKGFVCIYTDKEDGRQPAPRSYVLQLRRRISLLEQELGRHGINVETSLARFADDRAPSQHLSASDIHPESEAHTTFEAVDSSDRAVNFEQEDEHHYFGPTSGQLEFLESTNVEPTMSNETSVCMTTSQNNADREVARSHAVPARMFEHKQRDVEVTQELREHLEELYFTWQNPWYPIVDQTLFRESERSRGRYFSPLLLNCILAHGARFSDRPELRANPADSKGAGQAFIDKAQKLLHHELEKPTITTMQSLSILGNVYVSIGSDAIGWLYQGMANRLALDMGLNMDPGALGAIKAMPTSEIELRRQLYWAYYCTDKLAACYTGRICTMLDSQGAVHLPSGTAQLTTNTPGATDINVNATAAHVQVRLIKLSQILEKILQTIYAPKPLLHGHEADSFFHTCLLELKDWSCDLPSSLRIDTSAKTESIPQVYTLLMVYQTAHIILAKHYVSRNKVLESPSPAVVSPEMSFATEVTDRALRVCREAAREICAIATRYRQKYGSFRCSPITATHCTLSAALALLQARRNDEVPNITDHIYIETCLQVLDELSVAWWPAKRIRTRLAKMLHQQQSEAAVMKDPFSTAKSTDDSRQENAKLDYNTMVAQQSSGSCQSHDAVSSTMYDLEVAPSFSDNSVATLDTTGWDWDMNASLDEYIFPSDYSHFFTGNTLPSDYLDFSTLYRNRFSGPW